MFQRVFKEMFNIYSKTNVQNMFFSMLNKYFEKCENFIKNVLDA